MKNNIILVLTVFGLLFIQCQEKNLTDNYEMKSQAYSLKSTSGSGEFTILDYNVAGLLEPFSSSNPSVNTPLIAELVNNYDIVQVQEDFNYHAALYEGDLHPYCTPTSGGMGFGDGLNTMSNFPFSDDLERISWNDCNGTDCLTPKGFTWLRLRLDEGVYIDLYNLHTNAGTGDDNFEARRSNVAQFVEYIKVHSPGNAFIITGDFNCRYTRTEDNIRLVSDELPATDSWIELIMDGLTPEIGSDALVCENAPISSDFSCELVDKIFYSSNNYITFIPQEFRYEDNVFQNSDGDMLSDHHPVYTRFEWELANNIIMSDQFGGPHGTSFNDVNYIPENPIVTNIGLRAGSRVDQVNISLSGGITFVHGGTGGTANSLTLNSNEYVSSVQLCSGQKDGNTRIFYVKFTTNTGRTLSGGSTTSSAVTYSAPSGWQIVGFHGRSGSEVDKVGVIYAPI